MVTAAALVQEIALIFEGKDSPGEKITRPAFISSRPGGENRSQSPEKDNLTLMWPK